MIKSHKQEKLLSESFTNRNTIDNYDKNHR
jgi:hypothetical protein